MTSWKKLGPFLFFTYFNSSSHNPTFLKVNQRQSWISIFCYFCQIPLRNFLWTPNFAFYVSLVIYKYPYCHQIYLQNLKLFPTTVISELPLCLVAATFFLAKLLLQGQRDLAEPWRTRCFVQSFQALLHIWTRLSSHLVHTALCKQIYSYIDNPNKYSQKTDHYIILNNQ